MQLRLALSVPKFTGSLFKQSTSAILTGVTIAGAFATVIFNSTTARDKVNNAFETFAKLLSDTPIYEGGKKLARTFKDWGTTLISKKDDFKEWVYQYLNPEGFKSGAVALYEKLYDWAKIVFEWFRDKFWLFIKNIPKMVENWKQLRLSLFKWGTFLGGGGGSALWAMFGSGDNWGRLAELMGSPEFADIAEKFGQLMENNSEAFGDMDQEELQEMFESILDDPKEAKKNIEELLQDQKEMNENQESEEKEEKDKELTKQEILEKLNGGSPGSPKSTEQVFQNMIGGGMEALVGSSFGWDNPTASAKKAMKNYLDKIKKEVENDKRSTKANKSKKEFLDLLDKEEKQEEFISSLADLATKAYRKIRGEATFEKLSEALGKELEEAYLEDCKEDCGEESVSLKDKVPQVSPTAKKIKKKEK